MYAEYTAGSKGQSALLDLTHIIGGRRLRVHTFEVSGKREARRIACEHRALPWNF